jgi:hypothetical protein
MAQVVEHLPSPKFKLWYCQKQTNENVRPSDTKWLAQGQSSRHMWLGPARFHLFLILNKLILYPAIQTTSSLSAGNVVFSP